MTDQRSTDEPAGDDVQGRPTGTETEPCTLPTLLDNDIDRDLDPVEFGRVVALTDGVFAVAFTLLVLRLTLPASTHGLPPATALIEVQVPFVAFVISIAMVGTFFRSHHRLVRLLQRFDGALLERRGSPHG